MLEIWNRLHASYSLVCDCLRLLRKDPELILFPLMSGLAMIGVTATYLLPLQNSAWSGSEGFLSTMENDVNRLLNEPIAWFLIFLYYFANYFVITFFNSALVACAVIRAEGGDPTVVTGLRFAISRLPQILGWAAVAGTVGTALQFLESRSDIATRWVSSLLGFVWSLATFFVIPVVVVEKVGPFTAVRRSMAVMKETWGELLVAGVTLGPIKALCVLLCFLPLFAASMFASSTAMYVAAFVSFAQLLIALLVFATLDAIFLSALYLYASDRGMAAEFTRRQLSVAFLPRAEE